MPLYEYECKHCHRHTEKRQKFSDPEITECPHCGGPLERVISAPAIAFKGGGWYADGYGNSKPKTSGETAPSGEAKGQAASADSNTKPSTGDSAPASSTSAATPSPATTAAPAKT